MSRLVIVRHCTIADKEHDRACRQYAHTFHHPDIVCVTDAFETLPKAYKLAILLHEIGHLLAGYEGSEDDANRAVLDKYGIKIYYRDSAYGKQLEWILGKDRLRAREVLGLC